MGEIGARSAAAWCFGYVDEWARESVRVQSQEMVIDALEEQIAAALARVRGERDGIRRVAREAIDTIRESAACIQAGQTDAAAVERISAAAQALEYRLDDLTPLSAPPATRREES